MQGFKITSLHKYEDTTEVNFCFKNVSYRIRKRVGRDSFTPIKVNATGKEAILDVLDELRIEMEIKKQNKFIR